MKKLKFLFLAIIFSSNIVYGAASDEIELKNYVDNLLQKVYDMFHDDKLSETDKVKKSGEIVKSHLHLNWMAKHSLGRNIKSLPETKVQEFVKIYSQFIVHAYSDLAANYKGEKAILTNTKKIDDKLFIVNTEILKPNAQSSIKVDYLVHKIRQGNNQKFLVGDIITEGISILNSQQNEFNSVIMSKGIDGLISDLKDKINR